MQKFIGTRSTECSICLGDYRDPRYLPCGHTFCTSCIQQLVNKLDPAYFVFRLRVFRCPRCRIIVEVSAQGAEGFQRDVKVDELMAEIGAEERVRRRAEKFAKRRAEELAETRSNELAASRAKESKERRAKEKADRRIKEVTERMAAQKSKAWRFVYYVSLVTVLVAFIIHWRNQSAFNEERATSSETIQRLNKTVQDLTHRQIQNRLLIKEQQEIIDEVEPTYDVALKRTYKLEPAGSRSAAVMTLIDGKLLIANSINGDLKLRDAYSVTKESNWTTIPSSTVAGMGVCPKNGQVFVSTWNKYVYRFNRDGDMLDHWPVEAVASGMIYVTDDCELVLAVLDYSGKILIYSIYGEKISEIRMTSDTSQSRLIKAVPISNGKFLVSYGKGDDSVHGIDIINANGRTLRSYGRRKSSEIRQLNFPRDFALDRFGNILVVDSGNQRILLLDSELNFKREILSTTHGLQYPFGILLNECETRLYIADNEWEPTSEKWTNGRIVEFRTK